MDEIRIEKIARAMALADSREMILATSDASELHHVSDGGWKDYRHMAIAALAEDGALSPPEPTEELRERVAIAIFLKKNGPNAIWTSFPERYKEGYRGMADGAIGAMPQHNQTGSK